MESKSKHFPDCFYRVVAKGLCIRDGKVLLVHDYTNNHIGRPPEWELPGGGIDFGENFIDALKREVKEEMGLTVSWIDTRPQYIWSVRYEKRRTIDWYWVCFIVYHFDLENLNFVPSDECREIRFFSKEEMQSNINDLALQVRPLAEHFNPEDFK